MALRVTAALLGLEAVLASGSTCGTIKQAYQDSTCCNDALAKETNFTVAAYAAPVPLLCTDAEPQAPRDLSTGATGSKSAKMAVLNDAQAHKLPQTNVHLHLGAEHKSDYYNDVSDSAAYDAAQHSGRRLAESPRPGYMCSNGGYNAGQLTPYTFQYCQGVSVGKSYEVHYVHSTAATGTDATPELSDGLGVAAGGRGLLNPQVVVEAMVYHVVNDEAHTYTDLVHGWDVVSHSSTNSVMYAGSTTGTSFDNTVCSPYVVSWHVDTRCHTVSASSFDKMCKDMSDLYGMTADLAPHNSRKIVDSTLVVPASEVYPLA